jgi:hypothetical protein
MAWRVQILSMRSGGDMPEEIRREETPVPRGSIYEERRIESRVGENRPEGRGYISWGGVWGGVMGALGMHILLILFGLFIYFVLFNPAAPGTGGSRVWGAAWFLVTSFVALYFGGWLASKLAGSPNKDNGKLHGWVTWGLTTLGVWFIALMTATPIVTSVASIAGGAVAAAPQAGVTPGSVAGQVNPAAIGGAITGNLVMLFLFWFIGTGLGFLGAWAGGSRGATEGPRRGAEAVPPGGRLAA